MIVRGHFIKHFTCKTIFVMYQAEETENSRQTHRMSWGCQLLIERYSWSVFERRCVVLRQGSVLWSCWRAPPYTHTVHPALLFSSTEVLYALFSLLLSPSLLALCRCCRPRSLYFLRRCILPEDEGIPAEVAVLHSRVRCCVTITATGDKRAWRALNKPWALSRFPSAAFHRATHADLFLFRRVEINSFWYYSCMAHLLLAWRLCLAPMPRSRAAACHRQIDSAIWSQSFCVFSFPPETRFPVGSGRA